MEKKRYTTGQFAKKANVSVRTIQYYEKRGLIFPELIGENGYRYYGEEEFGRLQRILTLRLLGFSLEEIRGLSINEADTDYLQRSLDMQLSLVRKKIENFQAVEKSIQDASDRLRRQEETDWDEIIRLIRIINMDRDLVGQYQNGKNLEARVTLHSLFSTNPQSWFEWIYEQIELRQGQKVLELGCGNGMLWKENLYRLPEGIEVILTDISEGMLEDTRANLRQAPTGIFRCQKLDAHDVSEVPGKYDVVVANFLLFYLKDLKRFLAGVEPVMRRQGRFVCATYGEEHMKEVEQLAQEFEPKIHLSPIHLYENFGLENGGDILGRYFSRVEKKEYEDYLKVTEVSYLVDYILSCHGNQREYLMSRYGEFCEFLKRKMKSRGYLRITKQAGLFVCQL